MLKKCSQNTGVNNKYHAQKWKVHTALCLQHETQCEQKEQTSF